MFVHQILKSKADDGVLTLGPSAKVTEAVALLTQRRVGTVVISSDGEVPQGIVSERDVVREIGKRGPACLEDKVSVLMTADPVCCGREDKSDDVLAKMTEGRFRHMPVVESGKMVGLISIGDVVQARLKELSMEKDALQGMIMGH